MYRLFLFSTVHLNTSLDLWTRKVISESALCFEWRRLSSKVQRRYICCDYIWLSLTWAPQLLVSFLLLTLLWLFVMFPLCLSTCTSVTQLRLWVSLGYDPSPNHIHELDLWSRRQNFNFMCHWPAKGTNFLSVSINLLYTKIISTEPR